VSNRADPPPLSDPLGARKRKGPLAWMAQNKVAANLLMAALIFGGLLFVSMIKQEVFPEFELDIVTVAVAYPGASPEEVERAVTTAAEENIRGLDGIKTVTSTSGEGYASIVVELLLGTNADRALNDIKAAVDRITSFPQDVERPITTLVAMRHDVVTLVIYGDVSEKALRALAETTREGLLQTEGISIVELGAIRPLEIGVEVPREKLRAYGVTLPQVAAAIRAANVELPAGGIKTERGEVLLRTAERRDVGLEFEDIVVLSRPDGTQVKLGDLAKIDDGFKETDHEAHFNGKPAVMVNVFRVGDQTPIGVSEAVHEYIEEHQKALPPGVGLAVWNDRSDMYRDRIDLLARNAYLGLGLVLLCLGLFLEIRLAFWVTLGIPISFLGAMLFLPSWNVSINMLSLFGFIVSLGIVVDDAIVVGEAVFKRRRDGMSFGEAAVTGLQDVSMPVIFSVLTTVVAFSPLLFVPGTMGKFFRVIPTVVITVLMISLVESLLILPAHLSHENPIASFVRRGLRALLGERLGPLGWLHRKQTAFSERFEGFIMKRFVPLLRAVLRARYVSLASAFALLIITFGYLASGRMEFTFMPKIEIDVVFAQLRMPYGTPVATSKQHLTRMVTAAKEVMEESGGEEVNARGIFSQVGAADYGGMGHNTVSNSGAHVAEVAVFMKPVDERQLTAAEFTERWRKRIGDIPGVDSLKFTFTTGASRGAPISIQLSHTDVPTLEAAGAELAAKLQAFNGVKDVDDGVALGKQQLDFELTPEARSLGITETELARQVRSSFFGAEAARQQRGRDEIRVYVRLPEAERTSMYDLEELLIRTPAGGEIPLAMAARITPGRAYTSIKREDGRRVITVEGDVEQGKANANKVMAELLKEAVPDLMQKYPGLSYHLAGQQKRQAEALGSLFGGFKLALLIMFALMAIPFRSYVQPFIIMFAIPFGIVGAVGGHLLMGYDLSLLSAMGLVALSGVVVNDSLVLINAVNLCRAQGMSPSEAVIAGAARRFRPIMLTSLTTFLGLSPMIFETSVQARFLIPMALSLGYGVLFATFIILLVVPSLYLVLDDLGRLARRIFGRPSDEDSAPTGIDGLPAQ